MTDDQDFPRAVSDEEPVDPAALAAVQRALGDLDFLRPDEAPGGVGSEADTSEPTSTSESSEASEPMPEWAWARLSSVLAAEAVSVTPARRPSRVTRWAGGLAAASVAVVAVGVGVTAFQGAGTGGAVVAGAVPSSVAASAAAPLVAAAPADAPADASADATAADATAANEAAPEVGAAAAAAPSDLASPKELNFAGMASPTLRLVDSDTDYTKAALSSQVTDVLEDNGLAPTTDAVEEAMSLPAPLPTLSEVPQDGFTRTLQDLRDCVTKLTRETESTVLLVDRATYEGQEAGVVVAPPDQPPMTRLHVLVVDPECDPVMDMWIALAE